MRDTTRQYAKSVKNTLSRKKSLKLFLETTLVFQRTLIKPGIFIATMLELRKTPAENAVSTQRACSQGNMILLGQNET